MDTSARIDIPPIREPYDYTTPAFDDFVEVVNTLEPTLRHKTLTELKAAAADDAANCPAYLAFGTAALVLQARETAVSLSAKLSAEHESATVHIVQPVYNEAERMSPRTGNNPHGENALLYRLGRLAALQRICPEVTFRLIVVDDGCDGKGSPDNKSSVVAQRLLEQAPDEVPVEVLELDDLIARASDLGWEPRIANASESRKGGALLGGLAHARLNSNDSGNTRHAFVDIDADLSIHPDQTLSIAAPVINRAAAAAIASRRTEGAVACIDPGRDARGRSFISQWQSMLPELATMVTDVNRGLKAFSPAAVDAIMQDVHDRTFTYQIETLHVLARRGFSITELPVSYIDSVALSTQTGDTPAQTYDDQLDRIADIARRSYLRPATAGRL